VAAAEGRAGRDPDLDGRRGGLTAETGYGGWSELDVADTLSSRDAKSPKQLIEDGSVVGSLTAEGIDRNATQNAVAGHFVVQEQVAPLLASQGNFPSFDDEENGRLVVDAERGDGSDNLVVDVHDGRDGSTSDVAPTIRAAGAGKGGGSAPVVAYQGQGSNVGPMGTLRAGNGNEAGRMPFVEVDAILDPDAASGRDGIATTPSPDAEGRERLRNASLGVQEGDGASPTLNATAPPAVAIHEGVDYARTVSIRGREGGAQAEMEPEDVSPALRAGDGGSSRGLMAYVEGPAGPAVFRRSHKANDPEDPDHWAEAEVADTLAGPTGDQHAAQLVADPPRPDVTGYQIDAVHTADGLADPLSTSLGTGVQKVLEHGEISPTLRSGAHGDPGIGRERDEDRLVIEGLVDGPADEDRDVANPLKAQGERWHADGSDNFAVAPTLTAPDNRPRERVDGKRQDGSRTDAIPIAHVETAPTLNSNQQGGWRYDADQAESLVSSPSGDDDPLLPKKLDSHRYRVVGNGVVAPCAEFLGLRIAAEVARSTPP